MFWVSLCSVDYNVPLDEAGRITNNTRITASLPTIKYLLERGAARIILASHLGRPDGQVKPKMSLKPVAQELEKLLNQSVTFLPDCVGSEIESACASASSRIVLLENLRFHIEEEGECKRGDGEVVKAEASAVTDFCASLSRLADVYVQDAFGTVHRGHASIAGITIEPRVAGLLVKKELDFFAKALEGPNKIHTLILGGAKVADKIALIENMLPRVENVIIGGGMAFTFLKELKGISIGSSLFDSKGAETVKAIMEKAAQLRVKVHLPTDYIVARAFEASAEFKTIDVPIDEGWMGLDIGPKTAQNYASVIASAPANRVILWNGPMGVFEWDNFAQGTHAILMALVQATETSHVITIVGGGDSAAAVGKWGCDDKLSHVSTGGGASLELLEGKYKNMYK